MAIRSDLLVMDGKLGGNEIHVWHTDLGAEEPAVERLYTLLDHAEQKRASRFLVPEPRTQFIISRAFLRIALGHYLGIEPPEVKFCTGEQGKPELANGGLQFNLSHTEGVAAIAITRAGKVGIDVERIRRNLEPLQMAARFFSARESEWLRSQSKDRQFAAFFSCWTAKEAYIKARGGGLSIPLDSFGVIPDSPDGDSRLEIYGHPEESIRWSLWELDFGPQLRGAVAVEAVNCSVRVGRWSVLA